jgi:plastocyanin
VLSVRQMRALAAPALAAVVVAVLALVLRSSPPAVGEATPHGVQSGQVTIAITNYAFVPDTVTVKAGTRITFVNHDDTAHTATANHGAFDTGTVAPGHSRTVRATRTGVDAYHCVFHAFMTGTVTVVR